IVPGSTLMYGSSFCIVTRRPRSFNNRPSDDAVRPLPRELATPPVTKMCFGIGETLRLRRTDNGTAAYRGATPARGSADSSADAHHVEHRSDAVVAVRRPRRQQQRANSGQNRAAVGAWIVADHQHVTTIETKGSASRIEDPMTGLHCTGLVRQGERVDVLRHGMRREHGANIPSGVRHDADEHTVIVEA